MSDPLEATVKTSVSDALSKGTLMLPELSLVVLIGTTGSGKSTFARRHFKPTEILSSDVCRGLVADDENDQSATGDAFEVLHFVAAKRLAAGRLTVVDATNVQREARKPLVALAREYHVLPVAIVLDLPEKLCQERNVARRDRVFGPHVIRNQHRDLKRSLRDLRSEGFRHVFVLSSTTEIDRAMIERQPLWNNRKYEHGPFDIIGDVHGCFDELAALLTRLGYRIENSPTGTYNVEAPVGRKAVFVGDLVDRGPNTPGVLRLVMSMVERGIALCVPGNHDTKLMRKLNGKNVQIRHGLAESLAQLETEPMGFKHQVATFIDSLVSHYVLDDGKLVVAHAGLKENLQGRGSGAVRDFALYGETTGETDEYGLPVRYNWAGEYRGRAMVVYGHTPVPQPEWLNNTICIDTGCVYGGKLTALRYPEKELVSVEATRVYYESQKPLESPVPSVLTAQQVHDDVLDIEDVTGKRLIHTRWRHSVTVREENAAAALEVMSRFAASPQWLIYLPPTMSPPETSHQEIYLEHPAQAFDYFAAQGVAQVVCEEKHMGSRAVVILCRDEQVAQRRFGVQPEEGAGICYTRTGRRFFEDRTLEAEFLARLRATLDAASFWQEFNTEWVCLDCELLPWSLKAQELVRGQYAAVGAAARAALPQVVAALEAASSQANSEITALLGRYREREALAQQYTAAYRHYCWPVTSVDDLRLAPFHLLATEGNLHTDKSHLWHMETLTKLAQAQDSTTEPPLLIPTPYRVVDLADTDKRADGLAWWQELTERGGEGMVVKPLDFVTTGQRPGELVQPAIKCRGPEYLRIIYGPEYTLPENLARLRVRGLAAKRSLALREFALGLEGLERFVNGAPLRQVHECAFGVLALESEPVDPRL